MWQNVTSRLVPGGVDAATRRDRAARLLESLGLAGLHDRRPRDLSGGEQQRVALARAIVDEPDVLIADEPTSNVDAETGRLIVERFETLRAAGTTLVVSTHDPAIVDRADRRYEMEEGRLLL